MKDHKYRYELTVTANDHKGFMDAIWHCWEAFKDKSVPLGSSCPSSMGPEHNATGKLYDNQSGEQTYFKDEKEAAK